MRTNVIATVLLLFGLLCTGNSNAQKGMAGPAYITVRTETYPRPPYSGATYFIYERKDSGEVICTKLSVCNKFGDCENTYRNGPFKDPEDAEIGEPYGKTARILIPNRSLKKHVCLTRFGLLPK